MTEKETLVEEYIRLLAIKKGVIARTAKKMEDWADATGKALDSQLVQEAVEEKMRAIKIVLRELIPEETLKDIVESLNKKTIRTLYEKDSSGIEEKLKMIEDQVDDEMKKKLTGKNNPEKVELTKEYMSLLEKGGLKKRVTAKTTKKMEDWADATGRDPDSRLVEEAVEKKMRATEEILYESISEETLRDLIEFRGKETVQVYEKSYSEIEERIEEIEEETNYEMIGRFTGENNPEKAKGSYYLKETIREVRENRIVYLLKNLLRDILKTRRLKAFRRKVYK